MKLTTITYIRFISLYTQHLRKNKIQGSNYSNLYLNADENLDRRIDSLEARYQGGYILQPDTNKSGTLTIKSAVSQIRICAILFGQPNGSISYWMNLVSFNSNSVSNNKILGNKDMTGSSAGISFSVGMWETVIIISSISLNYTLT